MDTMHCETSAAEREAFTQRRDRLTAYNVVDAEGNH